MCECCLTVSWMRVALREAAQMYEELPLAKVLYMEAVLREVQTACEAESASHRGPAQVPADQLDLPYS